MSDQFYLYYFEDAQRNYPYCNVGHTLVYDSGEYAPVSISHSAPTFSSDPSQSRITVRMRDDLSVAMSYISHPPPFATTLRIWEVLATTISGNRLNVTHAEPHWSGRIVRIAWKDSFRAVEINCRTEQDIRFAREGNTESLHPLCRFHLGDGRCPVNIEDFKETAVVTAISDDISEPTMTVDSLVQTDDYYIPGMVRVGDGDMRTIIKCVTSGGDRVLTLSRAFPSTSVQIGDAVEVFAGDDLTLETCSVIFGAQTEGGAAWGGWKLTPNRDYQRFGIR
jgi:hypothetical protein